MRIKSSKSVDSSKLKKSNKAKGKSSGVNFSNLISKDQPVETSSSASIDALSSMDALMGIQAQPLEDEKVKDLFSYGSDLLQNLEFIHQKLVQGSLSPKSLKDIADKLKKEKKYTDDEKLNELVDQIELRLEIELAKIEKYIS